MTNPNTENHVDDLAKFLTRATMCVVGASFKSHRTERNPKRGAPKLKHLLSVLANASPSLTDTEPFIDHVLDVVYPYGVRRVGDLPDVGRVDILAHTVGGFIWAEAVEHGLATREGYTAFTDELTQELAKIEELSASVGQELHGSGRGLSRETLMGALRSVVTRDTPADDELEPMFEDIERFVDSMDKTAEDKTDEDSLEKIRVERDDDGSITSINGEPVDSAKGEAVFRAEFMSAIEKATLDYTGMPCKFAVVVLTPTETPHGSNVDIMANIPGPDLVDVFRSVARNISKG